MVGHEGQLALHASCVPKQESEMHISDQIWRRPVVCSEDGLRGGWLNFFA